MLQLKFTSLMPGNGFVELVDSIDQSLVKSSDTVDSVIKDPLVRPPVL